MKNPLVSVIITTKNSSSTLEKLLKSIKNQSYKNIEIIGVDNNSADNTIEIFKIYTKKVFTKGPERSAQRNFGVKKSKGKYILILDSDMKLSENVIKECVLAFEKFPDTGTVVIPEKSFGDNFWAKVKAFERKLNEGEKYFEAGRFFAKKIFNEFGGYSENLTGPEDWYLPEKIVQKYKLRRINSYIYHYEGSPTPWKLAKRKFYYGKSVHQYLKQSGERTISKKTVYFLRPAFYKNWKQLMSHPVLTIGLIIMLSFELVGGGLGYLIGLFKEI